MQKVLLALELLVVGCLASNDHHWSYTNTNTNPSKWAHLNSIMCSGWAQSPIALSSRKATFLGMNSEAEVDISEQSSKKSGYFNVTNNGHSLQVNIPDGLWTITLNDEAEDYYKVSQFHFHWGGGNDRGSEHTLDGQTFPLEMHIVAYSSMYANFSTAQSAPRGLTVIGVFFQLTTDQSKSSLSKMGNLLSIIGQLTNASTTTTIQSFDPHILLPTKKNQFFRYFGSLTTPPCTENVQWTVMRNPLLVTTTDLEKLRSLRFGDSDGGKPMQDNFRPLQPLNAIQAPQPRVLYKSWSAASQTSVATSLLVFSLSRTLFGLSC
ncbi:hypothetical protein AAHC03_021190 [Spirometra sp. Aus1]